MTADFFLTLLDSYGALAMGACGLPIPSPILLLAAGALMRTGLMAPWAALPAALAGVVVGDLTAYWLGKRGGGWLVTRLGARGERMWERANEWFARQGAGAIWLSRWLETLVAVPMSMVAGFSGYPLVRFALFSLLGRLPWVTVYAGIGYAVGSGWPQAAEIVSVYGVWIAVAVAAGLGIWWLLRRRAANASSPGQRFVVQ